MADIQDVTPATTNVQSDQQEAIQNVHAGNMLGVSPDSYRDNKSSLQDFVSKVTAPAAATPTVANWMSKSSEHAAALAPDTEHLNLAEKAISTIGNIGSDVYDKVKRGISDPNTDRNELLYKKAQSADGVLSPEEDIRLKLYNQDAATDYGAKDYGLSGWQKLPGDVLGGIANMTAGTIGRNPKLFAGVVAAEAATTTAAAAVFTGGAGALPGLAAGLLSGTSHAILATNVWDSYKQTTAQVYGDLDNIKDPQGNPLNLSQREKGSLANGAGIVIGGVSFVANRLLQGALPAMSQFASKEAIQAALASKTLQSSLMRIGTLASEMGLAGGVQHLTMKVAHELGMMKEDFSPDAIAKALDHVTDDIVNNTEGARDQFMHSVVSQALTGTLVGGVSEAAPLLAKQGLGVLRDKVVDARSTPSGIERDVTPQANPDRPLLTSRESNPVNDEIVVHPDGGAPSDIHDSKSIVQQADEALRFQDAVDSSKHVIDQTKLKQSSPSLALDLHADMLRKQGVDKVWMDPHDMKGFVDAAENETDAKSRVEALRPFLDPNSLSSLRNNQPIPIDIRDFLDVHDKFSDLSYFVKKSEADASTPKGIQEWLDVKNEQLAKKAKLDEKITPLSKPPEERAQGVALQPDATTQDIAEALGTKETAQAYLARLDKNEAAVKAENPDVYPGGLTKEEYLATGEDLLHGTSHPFDKFDQNPKSNYQRNDNGGVYFTDKEGVANRFARDGSRKSSHFDIASLVERDHGDQSVSELFKGYDVPKEISDTPIEDLTGKDFDKIAASLQKSGKHEVYYLDENGDLTPWKKGALDDVNGYDAYLKIFPKDHGPRVIKTKVYGKTIDLTEADKWPKDLVEEIQKSDHSFGNSRLRNLYNNAVENKGRFGHGKLSDDYLAFANSKVLKDYAAKHGIGKIIQPDAYESGFKSTYVPDVKHIGHNHDVTTNGEAASPEAREHLKSIQAMRERVSKLAEQLPSDEEAKQTHQQALADLTKPTDVVGEAGYLHQPSLEEAIKDISPDKEAERVSKALQKARAEVAEGVQNKATREMSEINFHEQAEADAKSEAESKAHQNPDIQIVDKFINTKSDNGEMTYQIDPSTLTKEEKALYSKDERMKSAKVFRKGSTVSPDDAAMLMGVESGAKLLDVLSKTPSSEEFVSAYVKKAKEVAAQAFKDSEVYKAKMLKAYDDLTQAHLDEMKYLKDKKWPATKEIIKRLGTDVAVPKKAAIRYQAEKLIGNTKVGELTYKPFVIGERKSQRIAMESLVKGDFEKAYNSKKAAALNSELAREAHEKIGEINEAFKFFKEMKSTENQAILTKAGSIYAKAFDEITDVYNFDPKNKGQSERDSAHEFFVDQVKKGAGDFSPLPQYSDIKTSANEMTVAQLLEGKRVAETIFHTAKAEVARQESLRSGEGKQRVDTLLEGLKDHPGNDDRKLIKAQDERAHNIGFRIVNAIDNSNYMTSIQNLETFLVKLDKGVVNGPWQKEYMPRLKGEGKYLDQGVNLRARFRQEIGLWSDKYISLFDEAEAQEKNLTPFQAKAKKILRQNEWASMYSKFIELPELKDNPHLPGKVSYAQAFSMMHHMGNEHNFTRLLNGHEISKELAQKIIDTLEPRYAQSAQRAMTKLDETFWPHVVALETRTSGVIPKKVQATSWQHRGVTYEGGYYPARGEPTYDYRQANDRVTKALNFQGDFEPEDFSASDMTEHGHTKDRIGGTYRLNLDPADTFRAMEAIAHDLSFREVLHDLTSLTKDAALSKGIVTAIGQGNHQAMLHALKRVGMSDKIKDSNIFDTGSWARKALAKNQEVVATGMLVGNTGTMIMHPITSIYAVQRMGFKSKGLQHFLEVADAMTNVAMFSELSKFASENNATIRENANHNNEAAQNTFQAKLGPKGNAVTRPIKGLIRDFNDRGFKILGVIDHFQKVVVFNASYKQFLAGDAEGWSKEKLQTLNPNQAHEEAIGYANRIVTQSIRSGDEIDKASIQDHELLRYAAPFFNEVRSIMANKLRLAREARYHTEDAYDSAKQGDYKSAGKSGYYAASAATALLVTSIAAKLVSNYRYGFSSPSIMPPDSSKDKNAKEKWAKEWLSFAATSPLSFEAPGVREAEFSIEQSLERGKFVMPSFLVTKPIENLAQSVWAAKDFIEYHSLSKKQVVSLMNTFSFVSEPLPTKALFEMMAAAQNIVPDAKKLSKSAVKNATDFMARQAPPAVADEVRDRIDKLVAEQDHPKENTKPVDQEMMQALKEVRAKLGK